VLETEEQRAYVEELYKQSRRRTSGLSKEQIMTPDERQPEVVGNEPSIST